MRDLIKGLLILTLLGISQADNTERERGFRRRELKGDSSDGGFVQPLSTRRKGSGSGSGGSYDSYDRDLNAVTLKITNLSYKQPFSAMFVMVHNADAIPLFTLGTPAAVNLQILAENGDPTPLAQTYAKGEGVFFSGIYKEGAPWNGGADIFITIPYRPLFPFLTIAAMAMNTNDGFVALNGIRIIPNLVITGPMYDAGSEINNEQCSSIPGPACPLNSGNVRAGRGEGFVHVHRGMHNLTVDIPAAIYDWRNPVIRVEFMDPYAHSWVDVQYMCTGPAHVVPLRQTSCIVILILGYDLFLCKK